MSNGYRAQWKTDSTREAEVEHFRKLKVAESFLQRVVAEATTYIEEKEAAIAAGVEPVVALYGSRATGLDATGEPLPEKPASENASKGSGLEKARKGQVYRARVYAPQMVVLGTRCALLLLELGPVVLAQWKRLVEAGIDPRRLALDDHDGKIAALLFDEIGVQYHDVMATDQERIREALDKLEAWVRKLKDQESVPGAGGPAAGPPVPSPAEGPEVQAAAATAEPPQEAKASPLRQGSVAQAGTASPTAGEKEPASPERVERDPKREAAPYSASGNSLDWTKQ